MRCGGVHRPDAGGAARPRVERDPHRLLVGGVRIRHHPPAGGDGPVHCPRQGLAGPRQRRRVVAEQVTAPRVRGPVADESLPGFGSCRSASSGRGGVTGERRLSRFRLTMLPGCMAAPRSSCACWWSARRASAQIGSSPPMLSPTRWQHRANARACVDSRSARSGVMSSRAASRRWVSGSSAAEWAASTCRGTVAGTRRSGPDAASGPAAHRRRVSRPDAQNRTSIRAAARRRRPSVGDVTWITSASSGSSAASWQQTPATSSTPFHRAASSSGGPCPALHWWAARMACRPTVCQAFPGSVRGTIASASDGARSSSGRGWRTRARPRVFHRMALQVADPGDGAGVSQAGQVTVQQAGQVEHAAGPNAMPLSRAVRSRCPCRHRSGEPHRHPAQLLGEPVRVAGGRGAAHGSTPANDEAVRHGSTAPEQ